MCVKDSNYNWAATRQNLSSVCPTKLDSNEFPQLQRPARKMKAVAQSNYQTYMVTNVSSNQQCEQSILKLWLFSLYLWKNIFSFAQSENLFKEYYESDEKEQSYYLTCIQRKNRCSRLETLRNEPDEVVMWRHLTQTVTSSKRIDIKTMATSTKKCFNTVWQRQTELFRLRLRAY